MALDFCKRKTRVFIKQDKSLRLVACFDIFWFSCGLCLLNQQSEYSLVRQSLPTGKAPMALQLVKAVCDQITYHTMPRKTIRVTRHRTWDQNALPYVRPDSRSPPGPNIKSPALFSSPILFWKLLATNIIFDPCH